MKRFLIIILVLLILVSGFIAFKHLKLFKPTPPPPINRSSIRIEVINCSGIDKAGSRTQDFLRTTGFDVYEVRSGIRMIDKTTIVERVNPELKNAKEIRDAMCFIKKQKLLLIPLTTKKIYPEIQKDIDSSLYLEATVILGKDCENFLPKPTLTY